MADTGPTLPGQKDICRYLTFRIGAQHYALPADEVAEVITLPLLARLPLSPPALLGLANLRGAVVAVASVRALLGLAPGQPAPRAILLAGAAPVALSIDEVDRLVAVETATIETSQAELAASPGERLRGAFPADTAGTFIKILDIGPLLSAAFTPAHQRNRNAPARMAGRGTALEQAETAQELLVSFDVAGQEYALPIDEVNEIIPVPPAVAQMPRSEALLLGVTTLRGTLLPLLSLRGLLGFPLQQDQPQRAKIIVTAVAGVLAGLVVDGARAIIHAASGTIQPAPAMLAARMGGESRVQSIYRDTAGRRIVSILAAGSLFGEEVMNRLSRLPPHAMAATGDGAGTGGPPRQYLVFRLGAEEFGLPVAAVDEVAALPDKITRLPRTPKFLEGVVSLRGDVLPLIDQRRRFDMAEYDGPAGRQRVVVTRAQHHRAGLLVDAIADVLSADPDDIEPAPGLTGEPAGLVAGVLNLPGAGRMILLLNPDELLSGAERSLLEKFTAAQKPRG